MHLFPCLLKFVEMSFTKDDSLQNATLSLFSYTFFVKILIRLSKLCVQEGVSGRKSKKQQQRLLRNMGAHAVVLELLQIPYEKVIVLMRKFCCQRYLMSLLSVRMW